MASFADWARGIGLSQRILVLFGIPLHQSVYDFALSLPGSKDPGDKLIDFFNEKDRLFMHNQKYMTSRNAFMRKGKGDKRITRLGERLMSLDLFAGIGRGYAPGELGIEYLNLDAQVWITIDNLRVIWIDAYDQAVKKFKRTDNDILKKVFEEHAFDVMHELLQILRYGAWRKKWDKTFDRYVLWADSPPRSCLPFSFWRYNEIELVFD